MMRTVGVPDSTELELESVSRKFEGTRAVTALRPTNLCIQTTDTIGIVGKSGSGKSTLLNLLGLLDRPSDGCYRVRGVDTGRLKESELTAMRSEFFGFVFQRFHLLSSRTVQENTELGLLYRGMMRVQRRKRALEALERVGMCHRLDAFPDTLSGGESQRVAIARAIAQEPRVLLCDEPTGNLDQGNSDKIIDLLMELNGDGLTLVVVTHDSEIANLMRRTLTIVDGSVSETMDASALRLR
jgi:putative ABC transport system ATP-binding protein